MLEEIEIYRTKIKTAINEVRFLNIDYNIKKSLLNSLVRMGLDNPTQNKNYSIYQEHYWSIEAISSVIKKNSKETEYYSSNIIIPFNFIVNLLLKNRKKIFDDVLDPFGKIILSREEYFNINIWQESVKSSELSTDEKSIFLNEKGFHKKIALFNKSNKPILLYDISRFEIEDRRDFIALFINIDIHTEEISCFLNDNECPILLS